MKWSVGMKIGSGFALALALLAVLAVISLREPSPARAASDDPAAAAEFLTRKLGAFHAGKIGTSGAATTGSA